ncbi:hypothetical protein RRG08_018838 [Elysia crispata]|uniref:Uncharacterized protein n=1 Tax=Elysia crispata TaxID=231223 RepID=A0AAE0YBR3_9GAST|nr:hypothetical protein RRG08_018838 [Elysia crispata]
MRHALPTLKRYTDRSMSFRLNQESIGSTTIFFFFFDFHESAVYKGLNRTLNVITNGKKLPERGSGDSNHITHLRQ